MQNNERSNLGTSQLGITENAVKMLGGGMSDSLKGSLEDSFNLSRTLFEGANKTRDVNMEAVNNMLNSVQAALNNAKATAPPLEGSKPKVSLIPCKKSFAPTPFVNSGLRTLNTEAPRINLFAPSL